MSRLLPQAHQRRDAGSRWKFKILTVQQYLHVADYKINAVEAQCWRRLILKTLRLQYF
jgi:hypothetical protein